MNKLLAAVFAAMFALAFSTVYATSTVKAQIGQVAADDENKGDEAKSPADSDKQNATDEEKQDEDSKDGEKKSD
jgi:hypothetical protein